MDHQSWSGLAGYVEMLYNCSRDADRFVKINAAFGLKFIDHKKAIPYLKGLFIDPDDESKC